MDSLRPCDHIEGVPLFDELPEGLEQIPLVTPVLDRDAQGAADLTLRILRGPLEQDSAFLDDVQPLRERLGLVEIMGREQDGGSFPRELAEHVPHGPSRERIQPDRRLVQEHERCLRRHDGGDHRALLLSPAQRDAEAVADLLESHLIEGLFGARLRGLASDSSGAKVAVHLLTRREMEERLPFLRHHRDEGSHAFRFVDDVEAEGVNVPRRWDQQGRGDA